MITYLGETNSTNEIDLITLQKKISFDFQHDVYKSQIGFELARGKYEEKINLINNKILNPGILRTKTDGRIRRKWTEISNQLIDTFRIKALQNLDEYDRPNLINIRINSNQMKNDLTKYKNISTDS